MSDSYIWFIGGHSAGHFHPLINVLQSINNEKNKYIFFLPNTIFVKKFSKNFEVSLSRSVSFFYVNYEKPKKIYFFLHSIVMFFKCLYLVFKQRPLSMYSSGGYLSIVFCLIAYIFRIPFHLYHLDCIPGKAAQYMSQFVSHQYILFEETKTYIAKKSNIVLISYPIRYSISEKISLNDAKKRLGICFNQKVVFILGGSQGSKQINDFLIYFFDRLSKEHPTQLLQLSKKLYFIHQSGTVDVDKMKLLYQSYNVLFDVFDYKNDLLNFYCASEIIISRAGAGTLAEIDFFQKNSIVIPLQGCAGDHQLKNAKKFVEKNKKSSIVYTENDFYNFFVNILFL